MSEILHVTQDLLQQRRRDLLHIEEKLCKYNLHHELLLNYKKNHKIPKGVQLKFNLFLCDEATKKLCSRKKSRKFKIRKGDVIGTLKNKIANDELLNISRNIKQKVEKLTRKTKSRHARK